MAQEKKNTEGSEKKDKKRKEKEKSKHFMN